MKKRIIIPIELEIEVDEAWLGGKIEMLSVHKTVLSKRQVDRLFKEHSKTRKEVE